MAAFLKSAARAFFQRDVALRRTDAGVRVVLLQADGSLPPPSPAAVAAEREAAELRQSRAELATLLDDGGNRRPALRHLAYVEHALDRKGFRAVDIVPVAVLQQALAQLEDNVSNWSPEGLARLRSKIAVAVHARRDEKPDADAVRIAALLEDPPELAARAIDAAKAAPAAADDADAAALRAAYEALGVSTGADG